jgi:hypothetical protein
MVSVRPDRRRLLELLGEQAAASWHEGRQLLRQAAKAAGCPAKAGD